MRIWYFICKFNLKEIYLSEIKIKQIIMAEDNKTCLVCKKTEDEIPLVIMTYKGQEVRICPQHVPLLIHEPHKLAGLIDNAENFPAG